MDIQIVRRNGMRFVRCLWLFGTAALAAAGAAHGQGPLPPLTAAQGRGADVAPAGDGALRITFQPGDWPNAYWPAAAGAGIV